MADLLGVSRSTYAGWENEIDSVPLIKLNRFANHFDICLDYLCGLTKTMRYNTYNKNINPKVLGDKLRFIRKQNNDTQKVISSILSTDQSNYSRYELGKNIILTDMIIGFAKHYKVSIDWLCDKTTTTSIH